jgi:hypothetical protein
VQAEARADAAERALAAAQQRITALEAVSSGAVQMVQAADHAAPAERPAKPARAPRARKG